MIFPKFPEEGICAFYMRYQNGAEGTMRKVIDTIVYEYPTLVWSPGGKSKGHLSWVRATLPEVCCLLGAPTRTDLLLSLKDVYSSSIMNLIVMIDGGVNSMK